MVRLAACKIDYASRRNWRKASRKANTGKVKRGNTSLSVFVSVVGGKLLRLQKNLIFPEMIEPARSQFGIAHGVLDIPVPQVVLYGARVLAVISQLLATGAGRL